MPRLPQTVALLGWALFLAWALRSGARWALGHDGALNDFGAFYAAGQAALRGQDPYGLGPGIEATVWRGREFWSLNLNPPLSVLGFEALVPFDPWATFRVWQAVSLAVYVLCLVGLWRHTRPGLARLALLSVWSLALAGVWEDLYHAQIHILLAAATIGGWLLIERRQMALAGLVLGLVVALKPNFLVWPALLFLSGEYLVAVSAAATAALLSALPALVFGPGIYLSWLRAFSLGPPIGLQTNGSLPGLAERWNVPGLGPAAGGVLFAALAWWAWRSRPSRRRVNALGVLAALLASPIAWLAYTLALLPVFWSRRWRWPTWAAATLLVVPAPLVWQWATLSALHEQVLGSLTALALLLLLADLVWPTAFAEIRLSPEQVDPAPSA